jgi:hypothetical protein
VKVWMPLNQIAGGGHAGDDARAHAVTECFLHEGVDGGGRGVSELDQELAPTAEERTEESGDGEDDMSVQDRGEQVPAQPLRPKQRLLLLAQGTEGACTTGEKLRRSWTGTRSHHLTI